MNLCKYYIPFPTIHIFNVYCKRSTLINTEVRVPEGFISQILLSSEVVFSWIKMWTHNNVKETLMEERGWNLFTFNTSHSNLNNITKNCTKEYFNDCAI
jgi:hypothetical protein